jgi:hypothetical protein
LYRPRAAWADLESGPVPLALARRVTEAARARPVAAPPAAFSGWRAAAAAVVALCVGVAATTLTMQRDHGLRLAGLDTAGVADPAWKPALVNALAQEPALALVAFKGGKASVAVTRWFDTGTSMRCAEYKIAGDTATAGGIACRRHDGGWDVIEQDQ